MVKKYKKQEMRMDNAIENISESFRIVSKKALVANYNGSFIFNLVRKEDIDGNNLLLGIVNVHNDIRKFNEYHLKSIDKNNGKIDIHMYLDYTKNKETDEVKEILNNELNFSDPTEFALDVIDKTRFKAREEPGNYSSFNPMVPIIVDKYSNIFILSKDTIPLYVAVSLFDKLLKKGLKAYSEEMKEELPNLYKYVKRDKVKSFNFNEINDFEDIQDIETFYETFEEIYSKLKYNFYDNLKMTQHVKKFRFGYTSEEEKNKIDVEPADKYSVINRKSKGHIFINHYDDDYSLMIIPTVNQISSERIVNSFTSDEEVKSVDLDKFLNDKEVRTFKVKHKILNDMVYMIGEGFRREAISLYLYHKYYLKHEDEVSLYSKFKIPSGNKTRTINAPNEHIKKISKQMNNVLNASVTTTVRKLKLDDVVMGYREDVSVQDNALVHADNDYVIKADFSKFFDTVTYDYCHKYLEIFLRSHKDYEKDFSEKKRNKRRKKELMKQVFLDCLFNLENNYSLYMGNPISGSLSNLVMIKFSNYINNIVKAHNIKFTIYADDLTFSAKSSDPEAMKFMNKKYIQFIIEEALYRLKLDNIIINEKKTMVMKKQKRRITGIRINDSNNITWDRHRYRELRALFHNLSKSEKGLKDENLSINNVKELRGKISFFLYTSKRNAEEKETNIQDDKFYKLIKKYEDVLIKHNVIGEDFLTRNMS